jgi:beta-N-acetylhexosaminidase
VITSIGSASKNNIDAYETYIPKMIIKVANEQNKEIMISSASLPYDVVKYKDDVKVITVCYDSRGHDVTDPSSSSLSYEPNIPALLDIVFGYHDPNGHLPVDTYKIEKNGNYDLNETIYPFNWRVFPPKNTDAIIIPLKSTFR